MLRKAIGVLGVLCLTAGIQTALADSPHVDVHVGDLAPDKLWSVNVIAYDNCPKSDKANRIAVLANYTRNAKTGDLVLSLDKTNKIYVTPGEDFEVLDSNACDGDGAALQLMGEYTTSVGYELFVRLVGPPGSSINVDDCAINPLEPTELLCDADAFIKVRAIGNNSRFTDATNHLLKYQGDKLFAVEYEGYFWDWGTGGKPHAQLWFVDR